MVIVTDTLEHPFDYAGVVVGRIRRGPLGAVEVELVVDGWRCEVLVESDRRAQLRRLASRGGAAASASGAIEVRAMIPGRVVGVAVTAGDVVSPGQPLLVVEAMKMQNEVRAPAHALVARVAVSVGDNIDQGDVLIELDAADGANEGDGAAAAAVDSDTVAASVRRDSPVSRSE
jgi:biotin carboxyl carrier protein